MQRNHLAKKIAAGVLAAAMMLPGPAMAAFSDTSGNWAETAIEKWSEEYGIIQGYTDGTFRPDDTITRGAFAVILDRFLQYRSESSTDTFSDTPGTWCESAVLKLNSAGVYLGTNGKALISSNITRQQAVTMIARAFGISGTSTALPYADADAVAEVFRSSIAAMEARGYLTDVGSDGRFRPADDITRAEVVNILNNMVAVLYQNPGTYTSNINGTLMINAADGATLNGVTVSGDLIIAPGVTGNVTLKDSSITGKVRNMGTAGVMTVTTPTISDETTADSDYITYEGKKTAVLTDVEKNQLSAKDFYWDENGRLACTSDLFDTRFGIDVAAYQNRNSPNSTIDWDAVKNDGVDFAMIRIALRGTGSGGLFPDAFYEQNVDGALAAGIDTGVYIFSQAISVEEAVEEADYVIKLLDGRKLTGPVAYDWEMKDSTYRVYGLDSEIANAAALAFCSRIKEAGYQPMIYCSRYVGYFKFNLSDLKEYPIWYPEYKYSSSSTCCPNFYYQVNYWQYQDKTKIAGIGGNVDVDLQFIKK